MLEQIMMDGEPLNVGNQVYSLRFGKGEVKRFDMDEYPIVVLFGSDIWSFTQDLQADLSDVGRDLYWQKPEIIPPPKPKKKVKVWDWFVQWEFQGSTRIDKLCATTEGLVRKTYTGAECIIQKIEGTEREVER